MSDDDRLMTHEYDGIQEYDNPLPSWWSGIFIATIVFAAAYWIWFHAGGPGKSPEEQFQRDWGKYAAWKAEAEKTARLDVTEELLAGWATDPEVLETGARLFAQNCTGCHLADGSGQVGPNLTDDYQIHGVGRIHLYETIRDGVPAKGMISWGATMTPRDMASVAAYVSTLRGKNLPGKAPEGGRLSVLQP
jgi:cytochrome c oxidase cbb3-type subunit 3